MLYCKYNIDVLDIEYLSHGDKAYLARACRLRGQGPFSPMIDAYGDAWIADDGFVYEPSDHAGAAAK